MGVCSGQTAEIQAGQPATASLMVPDAASNRLDVAFRADPALTPEAALTVRMWQGEGRQRLVPESVFTAGQAHHQGRLSFYFAVETDAPGNVYVWEISTSEPRTGLRVCAQPDGAPDFAVYGADWAQAYAGELFIAERLVPLPCAAVVYAAETIADEAQAAQRLLDEAFDLRQAAITDRPAGLPAQAGRPARRATLEVYGDTRVIVHAFADEAGLLVLGDAYHPGWTATIDGQPAPVQRVNLLWRGVPVPAGEHEVVFTLAPPSLRFGLAPGGAGAVGVLALLLLPQRRRDGQPQQPAHGIERGQDGGGHAHD